MLREVELKFRPTIAAIVSDCTDAWTEPKPPWREGESAHLAALGEA
jgi:hypothetical protein